MLFFHAKIYALRILLIFTRDWVNLQNAGYSAVGGGLEMFLKHWKIDSIQILYLINIILT